jgi:hypothetical protein
MKKKFNRILTFGLSVIGLGIVALVTVAIITTLRGPALASAVVAASPSPASNTQQLATPPHEPTTEVAYPVPVASAVFPSPTTFLPYFMQALQTNQEALKAKNLDDVMRHSFETKVAIYGGMATQWALYKKATPILPTYEIQKHPTATFFVGLREGGTSDFYSFAYLAPIANDWTAANKTVIFTALTLPY